jgi:hypothetical protein
MIMAYSDNLLRGLSGDDWVSDGIATAAAFQFKFEPPCLKENGCSANSICWEDNTEVVNLMLSQEKDGHYQFKAGVARLLRENIERVMRLPSFRDILSYERDPVEGNPYHGNLLVSPNSSKTQRRLLPANIAASVSDIISRV